MCTNNNGSYACSCKPGYLLAPDSKTCVGETMQRFDTCTRFLSSVDHQMWMNVLVLMDTAHKIASTQMEVIIAAATLDIDFYTTIEHAVVSLNKRHDSYH